MSLCVLCGSEKSRKKGPECRRCYKRLWQQRYRDSGREPERTRTVYLEDHMHEIDRMSYERWRHSE